MLALALKWAQPMKLVHVVGNVRWRLLLLMRSPQIAVPFSGACAPSRASELRDADDRYRLTRFRTLTRRAVRVLPPLLREWAAECFLRRANAPGPAAEHVVQYLLSAAKSQRKACIHEVASVAMGADNFYERQYRQYFNPAMGAFAMTATQALLASGAPARGHLWWHRRKTYAAMLDENAGAPPILVVEKDYGVAPDALIHWREVALREGRMLAFCVGATEEVFTQCSQNLFIKRPVPGPVQQARATWPNAWNAVLPLERLLAMQFETLQVTVSASGVPGASPRNGDRGKAVFHGRRGGKAYLLIPYHPGNAVHGHAAKLWSNPHGTVVIFDDHSALSSVTVSGPSWVVAHEKVKRDFPLIAREVASGQRRNQMAVPDPEYWYLQEVAEIVQQRESLAANFLDHANLRFEHVHREQCDMQAHGVGIMRVQRQQCELFAADRAVHHFEQSAVGAALARVHMRFRAMNFFARDDLAVAQRHATTTTKPATNGGAFLPVGWWRQQKWHSDCLPVNQGLHAASTPAERRATTRSPPISRPTRFRPTINYCSMNGRRRGVCRIPRAARIAGGTKVCDAPWTPAVTIFAVSLIRRTFLARRLARNPPPERAPIRYDRNEVISRSKWRPLKRSSMLNMLGQLHRRANLPRVCPASAICTSAGQTRSTLLRPT